MSKGYSVETKMGVLLDDPAAKEVLVKFLPQIKTAGAMINMARGMSLKTISGFSQAKITPDSLQELVADLEKL
jgi:TusA-related sulfurtransferase